MTIPDGWQEATWGDLAALEYGRALSGYRSGSGDVRVYGTNGPVGWTGEEPQVRGAGVIIGRKGAYRGVHYSPAPFRVIDTAFFLKPLKTLDLRWAYYQLLTQDINGLDSGSAIPSTRREDFYALRVLVPPLDEQALIAQTLGALDDAAAACDRAITTVSELLTALYEQFQATNDLTECPLSEAVRFDFGQAFKGEYFQLPGLGMPLLRIRDLKTFKPQVWTTERLPGDIVIERGDVVVGMDAEFRATLWLGDPSLLNQRTLRARSHSGGSAYTREVLRAPLADLERAKTGTTVIHLNKKDLDGATVRLLPAEAVATFDAQAEPLTDLMVAHSVEAARLRGLREQLLSDLLTGARRLSPGQAASVA